LPDFFGDKENCKLAHNGGTLTELNKLKKRIHKEIPWELFLIFKKRPVTTDPKGEECPEKKKKLFQSNLSYFKGFSRR